MGGRDPPRRGAPAPTVAPGRGRGKALDRAAGGGTAVLATDPAAIRRPRPRRDEAWPGATDIESAGMAGGQKALAPHEAKML